jgi:hypothetical protein
MARQAIITEHVFYHEHMFGVKLATLEIQMQVSGAQGDSGSTVPGLQTPQIKTPRF